MKIAALTGTYLQSESRKLLHFNSPRLRGANKSRALSTFFPLQLYQLRKLMQGSEEAPKAPLGNNARPVQPLHQRTIRTNINFRNLEVSGARHSTTFIARIGELENRGANTTTGFKCAGGNPPDD